MFYFLNRTGPAISGYPKTRIRSERNLLKVKKLRYFDLPTEQLSP